MKLILVGLDGPAAEFVDAYVAAGGRVTAYLPLPGDAPAPPWLSGVARLEEIDALAAISADCLLLAGDPTGREDRFKTLLRLAPADMAVVLPLSDKPDPLYELALMEAEVRFQVVPLRAEWPHPVVPRLREIMSRPAFGELRWVEWSGPLEAVLAGGRFHDGWTWIAALIGELVSVSATSADPNPDETSQVVVSARSIEGLLATFRLIRQNSPRCQLHIELAGGAIACELPDGFSGPAEVSWRCRDQADHETIAVEPLGRRWLEQWENRNPDNCKSWWSAATRSAEIAEAVETSLRRQRAVTLQATVVSEESTFKSIMTSAGCGTLAAIVVLLALAAAGVPYVDLLTLPLLGVFLMLQVLLLVARRNR